MIAAGILLSGVQNLAVDIAGEKGDGTLKRLGGSPLPVISYFIGKMGQVLATSVLQIALLLVMARFAFNVALPTDPAKWLHVRLGLPAGDHHVRGTRDRAVVRSAVGRQRDGRDHPDRARAAVHLGRLPGVQPAADLAAEHREHLSR